MSVDFLAIEVFTFTPHLETSGEVCLEQLGRNKNVAHCFIDVDNPDEKFESRSRWFSKKNKVKRLHKILREKNIEVDYISLRGKTGSGDIKKFSSTKVSSVEELRKLKYKGANLGIGVASSLISKMKDSEPDVTGESRMLIETYLRSSAAVYEQSRKLIKKMKPKKVMVFNGRVACVKAISEAAKTMGVPVVFHEKAPSSDAYVVVDIPVHNFKGRRDRRDKAWKAGSNGKEDLGAQFFERRRKGETNGPNFTENQVENRFPSRKGGARFVYFSSSDDEFAAVEDAIEHRAFDSQRHAVKWLIGWVGEQENTELIIRVHPHLAIKSEKERNWWTSLNGKNVTLITPEDETDSYALAESSDVVLAYNSTIGVEASYWGVPSISLGDTFYRGLDCVYEPDNVEELEALLENDCLVSKPSVNCLPYGYYAMSFGQKYKYFEPDGLFRGKFLGEELSYESRVHQKLRRGVLVFKKKLGLNAP